MTKPVISLAFMDHKIQKMCMKLKNVIYLIATTIVMTLSTPGYAEKGSPSTVNGKYSPPEDNILVFIGQDNESVGGSKKWSNGYLDTIGVPAGITHYVYFTEGKKNRFGFSFSKGDVDGLNKETTWGGGPMCMRCYLESELVKGTVIHLSISMEFDDEELVAKGKHDHNIKELAKFLKEFSDYPFLIRIGYEFDGPWNHYKAEPFKKAWRRIVDKLRKENVTNFATVMASWTMLAKKSLWEEYWPGDDYVDWIGYSYWSGGDVSSETLDFAREKGKPAFIAEASPRGFFLNLLNGMVWHDWYDHFFNHVEKNKDVIRAISYINANWEGQPMWKGDGWGNSQIQTNDALKKRWLEEMDKPLYKHDKQGVYQMIGFK